MTFAAVGSAIAINNGFTLAPAAIGHFVLAEVTNDSNNTVTPTGMTSANATWTLLGTTFSGTTNAFTAGVFIGKVTATGSQTVTVTWSGTAPGVWQGCAQEFSTTAGFSAVSLDVQGHIDSAGTSTWASLSPAGSGELYFGYAQNAGSATAGSTSGYTYNANVDTHGNGMAYNPACSASAQAPVWGDSGEAFGIMVLVKELSAAPAQAVIAAPAQPLVPKPPAAKPQVITGRPWTVLQSASGGTATFGTNLSAGTKIIALVSTNGAGATLTSLKDGAGNTWTQLATVTEGSFLTMWLCALDVPSGDIGTKPTLTATVSGGGSNTVVVAQEVSGLLPGSTSAMLDGIAATLTGSTTATGSPSYSSTAADEYLISAYGDGGDGFTVVQPAGWTLDAHSQNSSTLVTGCIAYENSTGGSEAGSWTGADTTTGWGLIEVAFKLAGAPSPPPAPVQAVIQAPRLPPVPLPPAAKPQVITGKPTPLFAAVGSAINGGGVSSFSLTPGSIGDLILIEISNQSNNTVYCTGLSSSNVTWAQMGTTALGSSGNGTTVLFAGTVTSTSTATVTISWSGTVPGFSEYCGQEFSSTTGSWALDVQGNLDTPGGTNAWPSLTPAGSGELYFGFAANAGTSVNGSTSGYTYFHSANGNGMAYDLNCTGGVATAPAWGDSGQAFGIMVLVKAVPPAAPAPVQAVIRAPVLPPQLKPVTAKPQVIASAGPFSISSSDSGSSAFSGAVPNSGKPSALICAVPQPPQVKPLTAKPAVITGTVYPPYLAGIVADSTGGHFVDQYGNPRLWVFDWIEGLLTNGGRWSGSGGGTYQQDFDNYCSQRAAQGLTAMLVEHIGNNNNGGVFANGNTWDNVAPFNTGQDPTSGLNPAYWQRVDYLLNAALRNGITVCVIFDMYCAGTGGCFSGWTLSQFQTFGSLMGTRYKNQPNLLWLFGDDVFFPAFNSEFNSILTGLASAGDTHMVAPMWMSESTARYETDNNAVSAWGQANAVFNDCYSYNASYWVIEYAYGEVANQGASSLLPTVLGNGYHYQGGTAAYSSTFDRALRQEWWWCLAAGGRGGLAYDVDCYNWSSGSDPAQVTGAWFFANNLKNIVSYYSSLPNWHQLVPDLSSAFVTSGRGTRVSGITAGNAGGVYEPKFTNSWVAASRTADGSLAVCYLPNSTTITVNTSLMAPGWTASWIDPVTGAATSAGTSGTYNSTTKGTNSKGDPDWVLVFQAPDGLGIPSAVISVPQPAQLKPPAAKPQVITGPASGSTPVSSADAGHGSAAVTSITVIPVTQASGHGAASAALAGPGLTPVLLQGITRPGVKPPAAKPQVFANAGPFAISSADSGHGTAGVTAIRPQAAGTADGASGAAQTANIRVTPVTGASGHGAASAAIGIPPAVTAAVPQPAQLKPPAAKPQVLTGTPPVSGAAFVQSASNTATGASTVTVTLGAPTTAHNCLVVAASSSDTSVNPHVTGITLGGSADHFAQLVSAGDTTTSAEFTEIWADPDCAGGQTSVVVTWSANGAHEQQVFVYEFSGLALSAILDKSSSAFTTTTQATFSSGTTAATAQANELWFGADGGFAATTTGPASPWINSSQLGAAGRTLMAGYQFVSSTGTATYSGTYSPNSYETAAVVTLKLAGAAPPPASAQALIAAVPQPAQLKPPAAKPQVITGPAAGTTPVSSADSGHGAAAVTSITVIPVTQESGHGSASAAYGIPPVLISVIQPVKPLPPAARPAVITGPGVVHVGSSDTGHGAASGQGIVTDESGSPILDEGGTDILDEAGTAVPQIDVTPVTQASGHATSAGRYGIPPALVIPVIQPPVPRPAAKPQVITGPAQSGGNPVITSADFGHGQGSGFFFISAAGTGTAAGGIKPFKVHTSAAGHGTAQALNAWPSSADRSHGKAQALAGWPEGFADAAGRAAVLPLHRAQAATGSAAFAVPPIGIYTFLPPSWSQRRGLIHVTGVDELGREVPVVVTDRPSWAVIQLAFRVSGARVTKRVTASAAASCSAQVVRKPVSVSIWTSEAAQVTVTLTGG